MTKLKISSIDKQTWIITQGEGRGATHSYLIEGKDKAVLIDTGLIVQDFLAVVKKLTAKDVKVLNTHGHIDHIANNHQFKEVYIHPKDFDLLKDHSSYDLRYSFLAFQAKKTGLLAGSKLDKEEWLDKQSSLPMNNQYLMLSNRMILELGNRQLQIIELPGHTDGSICVYDKERNYFFVGDMLCEEGVLLHFSHSASVQTYVQSMKKLKEYSNDSSIFYSGHQKVPLHQQWLVEYIGCANQILILEENTQINEPEKTFCYKNATLTYNPLNIF